MVGKLFALGAEAPYRHAPVWVRESTTGPERLRVGAGERPLGPVLHLARCLEEPLFVLAVLRVPRVGDACKLESMH